MSSGIKFKIGVNMKDKIDMVKIKGYDKFKCIADKCKFTCCSGWDINVDSNTYDKWKNKENGTYLLDNIKFKKSNGENSYLIKKEIKADCPFLSDKGLCNIVINEGEDYLSSTCKRFPRIESTFDDTKELTLSCSCPEVVNIISDIKEKIVMDSKDESSYVDNLGALKIRETLINIIQKEDINLGKKLIVSYDMLLNVLDREDLTTYEALIDFLNNYKLDGYIKEELNKYKSYEKNDTVVYLKEINLLFVDMIENYRNVPIFEEDLREIYQFTKKINRKSVFVEWEGFKKTFEEYESLNEKIISAKVLSNCISNDIEEMIISFEMIILEYLLTRYAVFLKHCMNIEKEVSIEWIKNYTVIFSRIISNNINSVIDFLIETFESEILELDYLCFLVLS